MAVSQWCLAAGRPVAGRPVADQQEADRQVAQRWAAGPAAAGREAAAPWAVQRRAAALQAVLLPAAGRLAVRRRVADPLVVRRREAGQPAVPRQAVGQPGALMLPAAASRWIPPGRRGLAAFGPGREEIMRLEIAAEPCSTYRVGLLLAADGLVDVLCKGSGLVLRVEGEAVDNGPRVAPLGSGGVRVSGKATNLVRPATATCWKTLLALWYVVDRKMAELTVTWRRWPIPQRGLLVLGAAELSPTPTPNTRSYPACGGPQCGKHWCLG